MTGSKRWDKALSSRKAGRMAPLNSACRGSAKDWRQATPTPVIPSLAAGCSQSMDQELDQPESSSAEGICATLLADAPWNAKSVIAAAVATVGGFASWAADLSSPAVLGIGGSYLGGFFFGWAFRRFLKMTALIMGLLLTCIAVLEDTGWIDLAGC